MSFSNLFYASYWFSQPAILSGSVLTAWLLIWLGFVLLGLIVLWLRHSAGESAVRRLYGRLASALLTLGLLGLVWLWLRQERVHLLAWRFWLLIWFALATVLLGRILYYALRRVPQIRQEQAVRTSREKYL